MAKKRGGRKMGEPRGKLTTRQRGFLEGKLAGQTDMRAALDAGYSESTARNAQQKILGRPSVARKFAEILEAAGISDERLAQRLAEGLDAREVKFFQHEGKVISKRTVVDYSQRGRHLEIALKLKGHLISKHEVTGRLSLAEIVAAANTQGDTE